MNSTADIKLGQIVVSCSGRDKLKPFIVVEIVDDEYVRLVDGKIRKVAKTKLKKVKHIKVTNTISEKTANKLKDNKNLLDEEIRKILEEFEN